MRVVVNGLSCTSQSGLYVLLGHLSRLAKWTGGKHEYVVLFHARNREMVCDLGENVRWIKCPWFTGNWLWRRFWEIVFMRTKGSQLGADFFFTPAGIGIPGLTLPQVVFAQNPWCLVDSIKRSFGGQIKASLQRRAYSDAMRIAALMVFNSHYMHRAYKDNAGFDARDSMIVYQAVSDQIHKAAELARGRIRRKPRQIVSVSAMAPHKGIETVVQALAVLRKYHRIDATLLLVGNWPDAKYERTIRRLVDGLHLADAVKFAGYVTPEQLNMAYAESAVFCLMSRCESFGIPAIEAQAFGTPVVSSNCCAIPEVCGKGGVYLAPNDAAGVAQALAKLLTNTETWNSYSTLAIDNALKYNWDDCSRPLLDMFNRISAFSQ